jgi:hypothetical protein
MRAKLEISAEEVALVREQGECLVSSYQQWARPNAVPDRKQPTEWHEGKKLLALAKKLAAYRRRTR